MKKKELEELAAEFTSIKKQRTTVKLNSAQGFKTFGELTSRMNDMLSTYLRGLQISNENLRAFTSTLDQLYWQIVPVKEIEILLEPGSNTLIAKPFSEQPEYTRKTTLPNFLERGIYGVGGSSIYQYDVIGTKLAKGRIIKSEFVPHIPVLEPLENKAYTAKFYRAKIWKEFDLTKISPRKLSLP